MQPKEERSGIFLSTYATSNSSGENFIEEHLFSNQLSGCLEISDGKEVKTYGPGTFRLSTRNKLAKFIKRVPPDGEYRSVSIVLGQALLREFALEYSYKAHPRAVQDPVILLQQHTHYQEYFASLSPFLQAKAAENDPIIKLKIKEALLTLLNSQPELKDILFDFNEPAKIDIADYMERNFMFNLSITRFAYLTGRSISSFKRDFQQVFGISPGRWLLSRRLREAYQLIKVQGRAPSDVYITVGFNDLSHFSRSFKSQFGFPPSRFSA